jgi:multidrug resistance efflux pump
MKPIARITFVIVWLLAAGAALAAYYFWDVQADLMGVVETRTHKLGSQESGRLRVLSVALGDEVHANQVLAQLDIGDLETEESWTKNELHDLENLTDADRQRYALEYEQLLIRGEANMAGMSSRRADLEAKRTELEAVNQQLAPLIKAEQEGFGRARDLTNLSVRRDALASYVKEESSALSRGGPRRARPANVGPTEADSVILSMMSKRFERISELKLKVQNIENRKDRRKVIAPCDGRVVNISYLPGDAVQSFSTIVTIEEPRAEFVDVYVPEFSKVIPRLGQRTEIFPSRADGEVAHGAVIFIDPGYSPVPERLAFRKVIYWARKFRVKLDAGHHLAPGEAVKISLRDRSSILPTAHAAEAQPSKETVPVQTSRPSSIQTRTRESLPQIQVPETLMKQTNVEPSGVVWLADIDRYLIASDDTTRGKKKHAPWLFLMDGQGRMEPTQILLSGINELNDIESVAMRADGLLYLVSSQNISKKGNRPESRQHILKVQRSGRDFRVVGTVDFYSALVKSYAPEQLSALGLGEKAEDGELILNIEGSAWLNGDLLLGLKEPRPADGAVIWRLKNPDRLIEKAALEPGQLTLFGKVNLVTTDGRSGSISDLVVGDDQQLLALSSIPHASDSEQMGGLYRLDKTDSGSITATLLFAFPRLKPEGVCALGNGRYTVVFDTDNTLPIPYLTVEVPRS